MKLSTPAAAILWLLAVDVENLECDIENGTVLMVIPILAHLSHEDGNDEERVEVSQLRKVLYRAFEGAQKLMTGQTTYQALVVLIPRLVHGDVPIKAVEQRR